MSTSNAKPKLGPGQQWPFLAHTDSGDLAQAVEEQVDPFIPDPNQYARYQLLQNGVEVGFVLVQGTGPNDSVETWQLYNQNASGTSETGGTRGPYTFPSYQTATWQKVGTNQNVKIVTEFVYFGHVTSVPTPKNLDPKAISLVTAICK